MEYKGGTYISQVDASSEKIACRKWAENLEVAEIYGFGVKNKEKLIAEIEAEGFVPLKGLKNAWCVSNRSFGRLLINFIKTETPNNANPKSKI